jgi:hypothetical protein
MSCSNRITSTVLAKNLNGYTLYPQESDGSREVSSFSLDMPNIAPTLGGKVLPVPTSVALEYSGEIGDDISTKFDDLTSLLQNALDQDRDFIFEATFDPSVPAVISPFVLQFSQVKMGYIIEVQVRVASLEARTLASTAIIDVPGVQYFDVNIYYLIGTKAKYNNVLASIENSLGIQSQDEALVGLV